MATKKKKENDDISQQLSDLHSYGVDLENRVIYINGDYHSDDEVNYITSVNFIKNLQFLDNISSKDDVLVHMLINGGCWHYGLAMMDAIRAVKSRVIIRAYSQASSMSGVILQAADLRVMMPNTYFLMHYGMHSYEGVSQAAHAAAKQNEIGCKRMLDIFANRAINGSFAQEKKYSIKRLAQFFDKKMRENSDWYLSAEETVYYGLADEVYETCKN